jgi:hypothetical protein
MAALLTYDREFDVAEGDWMFLQERNLFGENVGHMRM